MTPELYSFILTLAGVTISLLLAIIGYFLNKHVAVTETLTKAVNSLNITVQLLENSQANLSANMSEKLVIIDTRLNSHSEKITEHCEEIAALKVIRSRQTAANKIVNSK